MPAHHNAQEYVDAYLDAAGIWEDKKKPLFRTMNRRRELTENSIDEVERILI